MDVKILTESLRTLHFFNIVSKGDVGLTVINQLKREAYDLPRPIYSKTTHIFKECVNRSD